MKKLWQVNRGLIVAFALMSGAYKVGLGQADIEVYRHIGYSPYGMAAFGALQAASGLGCLWEPSRAGAAVALACCNTVATTALFAAGQQPFGWISWVFVVMAIGVITRPDAHTTSHAALPAASA